MVEKKERIEGGKGGERVGGPWRRRKKGRKRGGR